MPCNCAVNLEIHVHDPEQGVSAKNLTANVEKTIRGEKTSEGIVFSGIFVARYSFVSGAHRGALLKAKFCPECGQPA